MKRRTLAFFSILAGGAVLAHQVLVWGRIDLVDILHHEFFSGVLLAFGAGVYIGGGKQ
ncbi:MAG: hypothetical protein ABIJ47_01330 [Candidatus Bathyarchaeota archaeon]